MEPLITLPFISTDTKVDSIDMRTVLLSFMLLKNIAVCFVPGEVFAGLFISSHTPCRIGAFS
jgi:hypothetical protein